jgi:phosphomannomutase
MIERLQGTDGVRRIVVGHDDPLVAGLSPVEAFLQKEVITDRFLELYCYCRIRQMVETGAMADGGGVVIGWDTRDPSGRFTGAALRGLIKGNAAVASLGVAPTPAIPLYQRYVAAAAGFVVTASHNPSTYNGVKIFTRHGMKLLPGDDVALTRRILATPWSDVETAAAVGSVVDARPDALHLFASLHLDPRNSLIDDPAALADHTLVVDAANGALSEIAGDVLAKAGFGAVIPVNDDPTGPINSRAGVADIEGLTRIDADAMGPEGRFDGYAALTRLLAEGRSRRDSAARGAAVVSAAIFDGDGDRFYRVDYDPFDDCLRVLSGDEASLLQATARRERKGLFVNTVESDLSAIKAAAALGYETELTAVGDKWILTTAILSQVAQAVTTDVATEMAAIAASADPSADAIEALLVREGFDVTTVGEGCFAIGAEETGHAITPLYTEQGVLFAGDGLKSCLNTYAATAALTGEPAERFARTVAPFPAGYKKTLYVYYVEKSRWRRGSHAWVALSAVIADALRERLPEAESHEMVRPEESDMLYYKIVVAGDHVGSLFIRNSGTEDKTGLNLRGSADMARPLADIGERVIRGLLVEMKDRDKPMARAEWRLLVEADAGAAPGRIEGVNDEAYQHLLNEVGVKQGLLTNPAPGAKLTERGRWYLSRRDESVR